MPRPGKTVEYLAAGWPARRNRPQDGPRPCASLAARILQGDREPCPTPTVWRVTTTRSGITDARYWCDRHLPDEDRAAAGHIHNPEGTP